MNSQTAQVRTMYPEDFSDLCHWLRQQQAELGEYALEPDLVEGLCGALARTDFADLKAPEAQELHGLVEQSTRARAHVMDLIQRYPKSQNTMLAESIHKWFNTQLTEAIERHNQADRHKAQAERYSRLAELAHDLRTPINSFSMGTELLEMSLVNRKTGDTVDQVLQSLRRSIQRMEDIIHRISRSGEHSQ